MAKTPTKTPTKNRQPTRKQIRDLMRAHGISEDIAKKWSEMSARDDAMALPSGDDTLRIANYIGWTDVSEYTREFMSVTTPGDIKDFLDANEGNDVTLLINTPGGSVFGGIEIANMLSGHDGKTTAIVTGMAASVGSLIAAACESVLMMEASMVMIHGPQTYAYGASDDFREVADRLDKEADVASAIYKRRMDDGEVDRMLAGGDHYMTPEEAVDSGFADGIYEEPGDDGDDDGDGDDTAQINSDDTMSADRKDIAKRDHDRLAFLATGLLN